MSIGEKIKRKVLQKLGVVFVIERDSGDVTGERLTYELNRQVTKPFIREHFLEATLAYDTEVIGGDVIEFSADGRHFLVANVTPDQFKNVIVEKSAVLYKTNVSGELRRPTEERDDQEHLTQTFPIVRSSAFGLLTEALFGHELEERDFGALGLEKHELYLPMSYGAQVDDRYVPDPATDSGEYVRIETIKKRRYDGVVVYEVGEDNR